jgi:hypothetical protein
MPTLAGIAVAIQFCFAFHVVRSGRPYWWILIILAIPLLGCLVYYFVEVFPQSREYLDAQQDDEPGAPVAIDPDAGLRRLIAELAACDSVDKRMALAEEYGKRQMHAKAEELYANCLAGVFHSDAAVLFGFARAAVNNRNWEKAREAIARLRQAAPKMRAHEVALLEASIPEGQGVGRNLALN